MKKPSHAPSIAEPRELRQQACQKLAALVPLAIEIATRKKAKLEAQIDAGKTLSLRAQRELEKIRTLLDQHHKILICTFLNRIGREKIQAMVRQVAPPEEADEERASNSGSGKAPVTGGKR